MNPIQIGQITDADVYLEGNRFVGRVETFKVGKVAAKNVDHENLGMIGAASLPSRALEALNATVNFKYLDPDVDRVILSPVKAFSWQLHGYVDIFGPDGLDEDKSHKLITTVKSLCRDTGDLEYKLGEPTQREVEMTILSLVAKRSNFSEPDIEYDLFNGIYRIAGKDVWPR